MLPSTCRCRSPSSTNSRNTNTIIAPFLQVSFDETSLFTPQACACCGGDQLSQHGMGPCRKVILMKWWFTTLTFMLEILGVF